MSFEKKPAAGFLEIGLSDDPSESWPSLANGVLLTLIVLRVGGAAPEVDWNFRPDILVEGAADVEELKREELDSFEGEMGLLNRFGDGDLLALFSSLRETSFERDLDIEFRSE